MKLKPLLISLLCCISPLSQATDVPIKEHMPFVNARKALIKNGWKPNPTYTGEYGVENILQRKGFTEIESCTVGLQFCTFNYVRNGVCLGVATIGEEVKDMKVYSWSFKCPEKD